MAKTTPAPRPLTADERRCLEQLEDWVAEVSDLLTLIGSARVVADASEAHARFGTLKRELRAEAVQLSRRARACELNAVESNYYAPAIQQVAAELKLRVRSTKGEEWRQQLAYALGTLEHALGELKRASAPRREEGV